jgi:hypothetical protein
MKTSISQLKIERKYYWACQKQYWIIT